MRNRRCVAGLTSLGALALAAVTSAQSVPSQFVVGGKAAQNIQDSTTINLATAERLVDICQRAARERGLANSIYVLDNDGNRVYMHRMDGQTHVAIMTAEMKARTALMTRMPSKLRENELRRDPAMELPQIQLGLFPTAGGLPIVVNTQLIGAIGIGGMAPSPPEWSDEICGHRALTEALGPQPPLVEDVPPPPNPKPGNVPVPSFALPQGAAPKANLPPEFVITGNAARNLFGANYISGDAAGKIAGACRAWAASRSATASIYIINVRGEHVHIERGDGQVSDNMRTAALKAETALKWREPTSFRATQLSNDARQRARYTLIFGYYAVSGGVPIVVDGEMLGAIGVSGVAGGADEPCAVEGLKATFGDRVLLPVYRPVQGG